MRVLLATIAVVGSLLVAWMFARTQTTHAADATSRALATGQIKNVPSTTVPAGPVNKTWYFAEGRVGKGFQQYFTIDNPGVVSCDVILQYNYTYDVGGSSTKSVTVSVAANSRATESVNNDLGVLNSNPSSAAIVATVANVNTTTTPTCPGVVVERPMYFSNFNGISSGTDVLGSTHLSKVFYFADVPTAPASTSYLTILNSSATLTAHVTATYYSGGVPVGTQTATVNPNSRGTITPGLITLPSHTAAIVNSDVAVMVERPTYFVSGSLKGAYDIIGVPALANDWLFAEGYTGSSTSEYLTISNLDPVKMPATVTILLKSQTGAIGTFTLTLNNATQIIWNVNSNNVFTGSTPEVSVEVKSTGAKVIVQREMYFQYQHTLPTTAIGGTDVIGQAGPAASSSYSFSEGYTNTGYNEWLTIQNPTTTAETIYLTLVNGYGTVYNTSFNVNANSRYTVDITAVVQLNFKPGTDSKANSVSMTVQTLNKAAFVAERPMYWNTSGSAFVTQGGGDILGYVGG